MTRLVLASASPARLATLRAAGVEPLVIVSGVDESVLGDLPPPELARVPVKPLLDDLARMFAARIGESLKAQFIVENLSLIHI